MIGTTFGHYQIMSLLGKGGMGEVYQATDKKLGRDVAIKVLPEEFAQDADRVARFQREAKLLASLNHPNIAAIYGLEESGGTNFLVLELVEDETLADRLKRGPIPVEEALKLALQIAEALEAAHEKSVIHRDLKPANIKVTPDGNVKVLDFGLAKAYAGDQEHVNLSNSPTLSDMATQQGVILGTAAYMSPEQAKGKPVDMRTDIWAFGCVLYEMLTGQAAFQGEDVTEILAAVVKLGANLDLLPPNLHYRMREVITRCLQKEQKKRYPEIGEAHYEIEQALADPGGVVAQPAVAVQPRSKLRKMLPWAAAILGVIAVGFGVWKLRTPAPLQVMRFDYEVPQDQRFVTTQVPVLAISPDGKKFAYTTAKGVYLRSVDELTAKLIAGTEERTLGPFFSPDGQWIGYISLADRKLKKISVNGGAPVVLCNITAQFFIGADWNETNTIVYGQVPGPIMRVSANGGTPEAVTKTTGEIHIFPQILPGGEWLLYTAAANPSQSKLMAQSLKSGESKELFAGTGARYLSTGHLVYALPNKGNLMSVRFDLDKLEAKGGPVSIVEAVLGNGMQYAVSDAGTLVYMPGAPTAANAPGLSLVWVDRAGKEEPLEAPPDQYSCPKISPDGTQIALTVGRENADVWVWDIARKTKTRLTFDKGAESLPIWTPDGKQILFYSDRDGKAGGIYRKQADGTGEEEKVASAPWALTPYAFSRDGKTLVVVEKRGIGMLSMERDHARTPLLQNPDYAQSQPKLSPDGRWMAYASDESGKPEIYVRPFPDVNKGRWQVSINGGASPLWSPDGRKLFYFNDADGSITSVSVETTPVFKPGAPRKLFSRTGYLTTGSSLPATTWDIHPDGKRFLMIKRPDAAPSAPAGPLKINIVLNWLEELKQRVPASK